MGQAIFLSVLVALSVSKQRRLAYRGGTDGLPLCRPERLLSVYAGPQRREFMSEQHTSCESRHKGKFPLPFLLFPPAPFLAHLWTCPLQKSKLNALVLYAAMRPAREEPVCVAQAHSCSVLRRA
jgi:hypothetical protein